MIAVLDEVDLADFVELNRRQADIRILRLVDVHPASGRRLVAWQETPIEVGIAALAAYDLIQGHLLRPEVVTAANIQPRLNLVKRHQLPCTMRECVDDSLPQGLAPGALPIVAYAFCSKWIDHLSTPHFACCRAHDDHTTSTIREWPRKYQRARGVEALEVEKMSGQVRLVGSAVHHNAQKVDKVAHTQLTCSRFTYFRQASIDIQEPIPHGINNLGMAKNRLRLAVIAIRGMDMSMNEIAWLDALDKPTEGLETAVCTRTIEDIVCCRMRDHDVERT